MSLVTASDPAPRLPEVFVTKYALTKGILRYTNVCQYGDKSVYIGTPAFGHTVHLGQDCYLTYDAALTKAREMVSLKKASLKKQMQRLNEIEFLLAKPVDASDRR